MAENRYKRNSSICQLNFGIYITQRTKEHLLCVQYSWNYHVLKQGHKLTLESSLSHNFFSVTKQRQMNTCERVLSAIILSILLKVLGIKPNAICLLHKFPTTELHAQQGVLIFLTKSLFILFHQPGFKTYKVLS